VSEVGQANSLATAGAAPDELHVARALNNEYLKQHPDEVARYLDTRAAAETAALISGAVPLTTALILERMNPRVAADAVLKLPGDAARHVIAAMNPARAAAVVVSMPVVERDTLLGQLDPKVANEIREILSYPSDTAGALMDPRITAFGEDITVDEALRKMRTFKEKELGAIYLQNADGRLAGAVPLGEIATALPETKLKELVRGATAMVNVTASREEIVAYLKEQRLATLPVVDADSRLVGVIRYRQLIAATEADASMSLQTMLGVFLWSHSYGLVVVIGIAMVMSMIIAGLSGALVPVVLKSLRQDPATSSSIVLTTFTDCGGFLSFLGLATILSSLLPVD
jgi:magnesium transporter